MATFADTSPVKRDLSMRLRFQLAGGVLLAVVAPAVFRSAVDRDPAILFTQNMASSVAGTFVAVVLGFSIYRKMTVFPGIRASAYVIPSFGLAYACVFAAYFFLRLDYSRFQVGSSLVIAVLWFFVLSVLLRRSRVVRMAVIPGGSVDRLRAVPNIQWEWIGRPSATLDRVNGVVADLRADLSDEWERFIADAALSGTPVYHLKQVVESATGKVDIEHLSENTLGSLSPNHAYLRIKEALDWLFALVALILFAPIGLVIALLIKLDSPGPALFRQTRMGYRGVPFTVYKFRTMTVASPAAGDAELRAAMTQAGDARVTKIGRFLRQTRLDEVPQLFNILRGEMSWIGPRPEALILSHWYEKELPFYRYRHIVRPGISGWAQVNQGHVADVDEVLEKLHYDFYYGTEQPKLESPAGNGEARPSIGRNSKGDSMVDRLRSRIFDFVNRAKSTA